MLPRLFSRTSYEEIGNFELFLQEDKVRFREQYNLKKRDNLTIHNFDLKQMLGSGSFGRVYLTTFKNDGKLYALKVMQKKQLVEANQLEHVWYEKRILQALNFRFIIYMNYYFQDNSNIYFVLPFIIGGELFNLIKKSYRFDEETSKFYCGQIVLAIEYLHYLDLVYRDLKPENILIDYTGYIRITDFGFCKKLSGRTYTLCGTPEYLAPELLLNKGYGFSVDWWALGIIIYEMNYGHTPFQHWDHLILYEKILSGKYSVPGHFSIHLQDLLKNLLQTNLSKRYGCLRNGTNDIKNHRWFATIDWNKILNRHANPPYRPKIKNATDTSYYPNVAPQAIYIASVNEYVKEFEEL